MSPLTGGLFAALGIWGGLVAVAVGATVACWPVIARLHFAHGADWGLDILDQHPARGVAQAPTAHGDAP